jgi:hypothetical protein
MGFRSFVFCVVLCISCVQARDNHPDRHPDDAEAHAKFQVIGHAYQVLSDEKLRANYDVSGKDAVESSPKVDPATLFAMIFGSEKFVPLVGELQLASQMQQEEGEGGAGGNSAAHQSQLKKFRQKKREVQCAVNLAAKLQPYVDNENEEVVYAYFPCIIRVIFAVRNLCLSILLFVVSLHVLKSVMFDADGLILFCVWIVWGFSLYVCVRLRAFCRNSVCP